MINDNDAIDVLIDLQIEVNRLEHENTQLKAILAGMERELENLQARVREDSELRRQGFVPMTEADTGL